LLRFDPNIPNPQQLAKIQASVKKIFQDNEYLLMERERGQEED
jgi:hypothetical protein